MPTGAIGPSSKIAPMNRSQPDLQYDKETRQRLLDAQKSGRVHDNVAARARLAQKREDEDLFVKNQTRQHIRAHNRMNQFAFECGACPDLPGLPELVDDMCPPFFPLPARNRCCICSVRM
jgi:hypothetical protein